MMIEGHQAREKVRESKDQSIQEVRNRSHSHPFITKRMGDGNYFSTLLFVIRGPEKREKKTEEKTEKKTEKKGQRRRSKQKRQF